MWPTLWKGEKLYKDLVYFDGRGVKEIWVDGRDNIRPERPGRPDPGEHRLGYGLQQGDERSALPNVL